MIEFTGVCCRCRIRPQVRTTAKAPVSGTDSGLHGWDGFLASCQEVEWCGYEVTVYPKKYAHDFRFAVLCRGYTLADFPISIRLTLLALWQSNDCPSASKASLMNMDKYFM